MNLNWKEIQNYYDDNHTWRDLKTKFKITDYIIIKAKKAGNFKSRSKSEANKLGYEKYPRTLSEETKKKISKSRIKYLEDNPDKVPYLFTKPL